MNNKPVGLYIHIPFCLSKCPYCDFYSQRYDRETARQYAVRTISHLKRFKERYSGLCYDTVYFGGGTPILLYKEICEILESMDNITDNAEITVEANPCCTSAEALSLLQKSGVNRISFGLQSGNDSELKLLGRRHNAKEGAEAVTKAINAGISNISADIMTGIPTQTDESLLYTLKYLTSLPLKHISSYSLKLEPGTPFYKNKSSLPALPDDDKSADFYLMVCDYLKAKGFYQYEISNFAVPGYESRHNLKYWRCEEYIGIGPSAHSYFDNKRFAANRNLIEYLENEEFITDITDNNPGGFEEWAMLQLRLTEGLSFSKAEQKYGIQKQQILNTLKKIPPELYTVTDDRLFFTEKGFLVSNTLIAMITDI